MAPSSVLLIVNGDTRDLELSELEVSRVRDGLLACAGASRACVGRTSELAAQGDVEDERVLSEVLADVAAIA